MLHNLSEFQKTILFVAAIVIAGQIIVIISDRQRIFWAVVSIVSMLFFAGSIITEKRK